MTANLIGLRGSETYKINRQTAFIHSVCPLELYNINVQKFPDYVKSQLGPEVC